MEEKKQHFWHIMLYDFKKGKNTAETQKKICAVYGEGAVTDQTCQKWFAKFPRYFITQNKNTYPLNSYFPQPLVSTSMLSVSFDIPILDILYK